MKVCLRHIFIFHNTLMIMSLLNGIVTLVLILHLQPHLSHDVPVNTFLKFFGYYSFSRIFSKMVVSSCLIFQVFSRTLSPSFRTFLRMITMPLKPLLAQQLMHKEIALLFMCLTCTSLYCKPRICFSTGFASL